MNTPKDIESKLAQLEEPYAEVDVVDFTLVKPQNYKLQMSISEHKGARASRGSAKKHQRESEPPMSQTPEAKQTR